MKKIIFGLFSLLLALFIFKQFPSKKAFVPIPTNGETIIKSGGDDEEGQDLRKKWFDLMHQSAPGTNWKSIEYENNKRRAERKVASNANSRGGLEDLANGNLIGEWFEKGSSNQAGSVIATEYDADTDFIYLVSGGGTLMRRPFTGVIWEVVNQDYKFDGQFLHFLELPTGKRMLVYIADQPHYSDDYGITWTKATGIPEGDNWARNQHTAVMTNINQQIYVLSKKSYWEDYILYQSKDFGETYTAVKNMGSSESGKFVMKNPNHTDELFIMERTGFASSRLSKIDFDNDTVVEIYENDFFGFKDARANLAATKIGDSIQLVVWNNDNQVFQSYDFGENWELISSFETTPWSVGIYISPSDPKFMMMGAVECFRSIDGGDNWQKVNTWGEYYGDINGKLHADMMYFREFQKTDGSTFVLNSNHGGLNITEDKYNTVNNLGLFGLNVSQYYDVVSLPSDPSVIFAGTQDQGFQRSLPNADDDVAQFDQVISGDYGHIVFSENNSHLWTVYPGGWVTYYDDPMGYYNASWEVNSGSETVWIPPMMPSPDPSENAIYLAGGNANGGSGSYLIKLTYNEAENRIDSSQIDYDFESYSVDGTISMMRTSPLNSNNWYVSTTNGRFFYSTDGGVNWDQSTQFVPGGHYLYGAAIYPSKLDENIVYMAGSGYSNPAVYKSTNGGQTFVPMNEGMPQTLVFELTANDDETMFFAATEAGPFVYVVEESMWFDMTGMAAPTQTYWSVEYISSMDRVRFGTYGRGAWDFQIEQEVSSTKNEINIANINLFPNPTQSILNIEINEVNSNDLTFQVFDLAGKLILEKAAQANSTSGFSTLINLENVNAGTYILKIIDGENIGTKKFSKLK